MRGQKARHLLSYVHNSRLGYHTYIDSMVAISNCEIDEYSYVSRGTKIINTKIGRYCSIGPECRINMGQHPMNLLGTSPIFYASRNKLGICIDPREYTEFRNVDIGNDIWIGSQVTILGGVQIGDGAIVAAGSVVTKDVSPFSVVAGVPAKIIKMRFTAEIIDLLKEARWWELDADDLCKYELLSIIKQLGKREDLIKKFCYRMLERKHEGISSE